jgi:hypothetical protein
MRLLKGPGCFGWHGGARGCACLSTESQVRAEACHGVGTVADAWLEYALSAPVLSTTVVT